MDININDLTAVAAASALAMEDLSVPIMLAFGIEPGEFIRLIKQIQQAAPPVLMAKVMVNMGEEDRIADALVSLEAADAVRRLPSTAIDWFSVSESMVLLEAQLEFDPVAMGYASAMFAALQYVFDTFPEVNTPPKDWWRVITADGERHAIGGQQPTLDRDMIIAGDGGTATTIKAGEFRVLDAPITLDQCEAWMDGTMPESYVPESQHAVRITPFSPVEVLLDTFYQIVAANGMRYGAGRMATQGVIDSKSPLILEEHGLAVALPANSYTVLGTAPLVELVAWLLDDIPF